MTARMIDEADLALAFLRHDRCPHADCLVQLVVPDDPDEDWEVVTAHDTDHCPTGRDIASRVLGSERGALRLVSTTKEDR